MTKNKIKFKYLLNVWKTLPNYPTSEDIIYEVSVYLIKDGRPNGDISTQTFNSVFGSGWDKTKHGQVIETMMQDGIFLESEKSTPSKKWYKINPEYLIG